LAHTIGPRQIGLRSALRESLDSLLPLMAGQGRGTAKTHPMGLRALPALTRTGEDQLALKLGKDAKDGLSLCCSAATVF
jgi:hypothetical protein